MSFFFRSVVFILIDIQKKEGRGNRCISIDQKKNACI